MRFSATFAPLFLAVATQVVGQNLDELASQIPKCAMACIQDGSAAVGCSRLDSVCHCEKQDQLLDGTKGCFTDSCTNQEAKRYRALAPQVCAILLDPANGTTTATTSAPNPSPSTEPSDTTKTPIATAMAVTIAQLSFGVAGVVAAVHAILL